MLAGAYFRDPYGVKAHKQGNVFAEYEAAGYTLLRGRDGYNIADEVQRVLWLDSDTTTENRIGYAVDGDNGDMELPQMVSTGIEFLNKRFPQGFFMMVEGGAIDHMGHGNDPSGLLGEMCEFDKAVRKAYEFYLQHPDETLIVITADHETGGLALGFDKGYNIFFNELDFQTFSKEVTSKSELILIEKANEKGHIGWTTDDHSAANVPIFAIGVSSELFAGRMDNIDIPKKICQAMGIKF
jgi:alkaline phosphatase